MPEAIEVKDDLGNKPLLPGAPTPRRKPFLCSTKMLLLAGVVVQNATMNVAARWSRVEAAAQAERGECAAAPGTVVLTIELLKVALSLLLLAYEIGGSPLAAAALVGRTTAQFPKECAKVVVPAVTYVVQNQLLLVAAANLEGPVLALFGQSKILTTAVFSVVLLGRTLGARRWAALVVLTAGIATVQASQLSGGTTAGDSGERNVPLGLALILVVASLSGFAGVYFEKVLKGSPISLWTRNVHLALLSVATAGAGALARPSETCGVFDGLGPVCWLYILVQAVGGLLIAAVIKYADNILKAFATSVSILVVSLVSAAFFGFELSPLFFLGGAGVVYAIFLYGDLVKDLGPCAKCPAALGGRPLVDDGEA